MRSLVTVAAGSLFPSASVPRPGDGHSPGRLGGQDQWPGATEYSPPAHLPVRLCESAHTAIDVVDFHESVPEQ